MKSNKELFNYSREDFNKLILEKAKPIKMIHVYYRIRKHDNASNSKQSKT